MEVTPGQSAIIQDFLFRNGFCWCGFERKISCTDKPYLYFEDNELTCGWNNEVFCEDKLPKLAFGTFENKYMIHEQTERTIRENSK
jgi:hypothetical protein